MSIHSSVDTLLLVAHAKRVLGFIDEGLATLVLILGAACLVRKLLRAGF
jgi:hypothetical protein